jgi:hypothetical protein
MPKTLLGIYQRREQSQTGGSHANCGNRCNLHGPTHRAQKEAGQELLEFAVAFVILGLFIFGVLDLGRIFYATITIVNSAREGTRQAMLYPDDLAAIIAATQQEANGSGIDLTDPAISTITVSCPPSPPPVPPEGCEHGDPVRVTVTYSMELMMGWILPSPVTLTRYAEMVIP